MRITAEQASHGTAGTVRIKLTADMETVPPDAAHPRGFTATRKLSGSGTLRFDGLAPGYYAVKVTPGKGSTWRVTAEDHRSWWSLPW